MLAQHNLSASLFARFCVAIGLYTFPGVALGGQPELESKFGDWEIVCTDATVPEGPSCRMLQNHVAKSTGKTVLLVSIMHPAAKKHPVAVVTTPPGIYLAPGIEIAVDKNKRFKLLYETCNAVGCHAGFELKPGVLGTFKRGNVALHRIYDAKQRVVDVKVSLSGFTKAMERLQELGR